MNDDIKRSYSADLGHLVFTERRTGLPAIEPERRDRLRAALEGVLTNVNDFDVHYALLNRHYHGQFPFGEPLTEEQTSAVLKGGLQALDDASLARLVLSPVALYALSEQIAQQFPGAWWDILRSEGAQMRLQPQPAESVAAPAASEEDDSWLSTLSTVPGIKPPLLAQRMVWEWQLTPADCECHRRKLEPEEQGMLRAEWSADGSLTVTCNGFLAAVADAASEAEWLRLAGDTAARAKGEKGNKTVRLQAGGGPPRSWDRLKLRLSGGPKTEAWDMSVVVAF